jgi:hypothetical protein
VNTHVYYHSQAKPPIGALGVLHGSLSYLAKFYRVDFHVNTHVYYHSQAKPPIGALGVLLGSLSYLAKFYRVDFHVNTHVYYQVADVGGLR